MSADRLSRVALYALLFWPPLAIGANRDWPLAILQLLTLLGLAAWAWGMVREGRLEWRRSAVDVPAAVLVGVVVLQLALGNRPLVAWALAAVAEPVSLPAAFPAPLLTLGSVAPDRTARSLLVLLTCLAVYALVVNVIRTRQQLDRLVSSLVGFGGVLSFLALLDYLAGGAWVLRWRDVPLGGRLAGTFGNPDHCATWLAMLACLGFGALIARTGGAPVSLKELLTSREARERTVSRYLPFFGLPIIVVALVFTLSRGALLGLGVTIVAALALLHRLGHVRRNAFVLGGLMVVAFAYTAWIGLEPLLARIRPADYADRWLITTSTLRMLGSFPVLGVGLGAYGAAYGAYQPAALRPGTLEIEYAHNDLVQLPVELGFIGLVAVGVLVWRVGADLIGAHLLGHRDCPVGGGEREGAVRHDVFSVGVAAGALAAVVALLLHSIVDFPAHIPANAVLGAACLGIATVALHTRFTVGRARLLTRVVACVPSSPSLRRGIPPLFVLLALLVTVWILHAPVVAAAVDRARSTSDRASGLRRADVAVALGGATARARETRGQLRLRAALDTWNLGATPDGRVLFSWDERRAAARALIDGAIDDLRAGVAAQPLSAPFHEELARAYWTMALVAGEDAGRPLAQAATQFARAAGAAPGRPFAYRSLAVFGVPLGGTYSDLGLRAARQAVGLEPAMLTDLVDRFVPLQLFPVQWLRVVPDAAPDYLQLGALLERRHLAAAAEAAYRRVIEMAAPPETAVARWRLARLLLDQDRAGEALAELELALMVDSANPLLHLERARALARLEDPGADDAYRLAVLNADVRRRRKADAGPLFGALSPRVRAIVSEAAAGAEDDTARYRRPFAEYLTARRSWEAALAQWQALAAESPSDAAVHVGRGIVLEAVGARPQAVEAYRQAVTIDGNNLPARRRLAQALWNTDQYYQAINEWRTVLARAPGDIDARLALARASVRTGDVNEAVLEYQRLLRIAPDRAEARRELARLMTTQPGR